MEDRRNAAIKTRIERALAENDAEHRQLTRALTHLDERIAPSPSASLLPDKPKPRKRRKAKRARTGQRREQLLAAIKEKPRITVAEAAKKIGVKPPNPLYALAKRLTKEGVLVKKGAGYSIKA